MRNKLIALTLIFCLLGMLFLIGCSTDTNDEAGPDDETIDETTWKPERLEFLVPLEPGGGMDGRARTLAPFIEEYFDNTVVVENRSGAGGITGLQYLLNVLPANGETIFIFYELMHSGNIVRGAPYNVHDFAYLGVINENSDALFVSKDSPYETLGDLIEAIKDNPGQLRVGFSVGASGHILAEEFTSFFDLSVREMPYDEGAASVRTALLGNHIDFAIMSGESTWRLHEDDFRTLALFHEERHPLYPNEPTIGEAMAAMGLDVNESSLARINNYTWIATQAAVKQNHPERFEILSQLVKDLMEDERVQDAFIKGGWVPAHRGPEETTEIIEFTYDLVKNYEHIFK